MKPRTAGLASIGLSLLLATHTSFALSPDIHAPQVIAMVSADGTSIDVVWQDMDPSNGAIHNAHIVEDQGGYRIVTRAELTSLGLLAGFLIDGNGNSYHVSAQPASAADTGPKQVVVYRNNQLFWNLLTQDGDSACQPPTQPMFLGSSQIATGGGMFFFEGNIGTAHSYNAMFGLESDPSSLCAQHRLWQHNFGQSTLFDGQDFVTLENRDHEITLGMMKFSPAEPFPFANYAERLRSVFARTNYGNSTFTELGGLQPGLNDAEGYLVLFSTERDRDYLMSGLNPPEQGYRVDTQISPRDLAVIHVRRDFDRQPANWTNPDGSWRSMAPRMVDASPMVDSAGEGKTTAYRTAEDGWDWPSYSPDTYRELQAANIVERQHRYAGVQWLTGFGESYNAAAQLPPIGETFTTVSKPKLGRLGTNRYVAIWEEHIARRTLADIGNGQRMHYVERQYAATKAAPITLSRDGGQVVVSKGETKDLGAIRLNAYDEPISVGGKVAFFTYAENGTDLVLNTLDGTLNLRTQNLVAAGMESGITLDNVLGLYQHTPTENDWHRGRIQFQGAQLVWQNDAQVSWNLAPDLQRGRLLTDATNPYFDANVPESQAFLLTVRDGRVVSFSFMNTEYTRVSD